MTKPEGGCDAERGVNDAGFAYTMNGGFKMSY